MADGEGGRSMLNRIGKVRVIGILCAIVSFLIIIILAKSYFENRIGVESANSAFRYGYFLCGAIAMSFIMLSIAMDYDAQSLSQLFFFNMTVVADIDLLVYAAVDTYDFGINLNYVMMTVSLLITPVLCSQFWIYQNETGYGGKYKKSWLDYVVIVGTIADCIFIIVGTVLGKMFSFDSDGHYYKGALIGWTYIYPIVQLIICACLSIKYKIHLRKKIALLIFSIMPIILATISLIKNDTLFSHSANMIGIMTIYIGIQSFKRVEMVEQSKELETTRINAALMQIRPHFIQNCLSNIRGLMHVDVNSAQALLTDLSRYLRDTYTHLNKDGMITIAKEMELVDYFLAIEQARFPGFIIVEKHLEISDFLIPSFTIEPLVENAIRHGIREKEGVGTVKIQVLDHSDCLVIKVIDDGVGFDTKMLQFIGDESIGIENVRKRIELMSHGSLMITSTIGSGTTATIELPKNGARR